LNWVKLNSRHKVVLFLTLLVSGFSLIAGEGFRTAFGVMLVGLALCWAVGSDSRTVHFLFLGCGLLLLVASFAVDWREGKERKAHYERQLAEYRDRVELFRRRIPQLAERHPLPRDVLAQPPFSIVQPLSLDLGVKAAAYQAFYSSGDFYDFKSQFAKIPIPEEAKAELWAAKSKGKEAWLAVPGPMPSWAAEALANGVDLATARMPSGHLEPALKAWPGDEPDSTGPSLRSRMADVAPLIAGGCVLSMVGVGLLLTPLLKSRV
jgi:hypothetical protein